MKRTQKGMTIWGWLMVLALIGFFSIIIMTLFPVYMENMSVKKAVKQVAAQPGIQGLKQKQIYERLDKQFYIDDVRSVREEDVSIDISDDGAKYLVVTYEVRKPIMFNVDAVVWFEEKRELGETE